MGVSRHFAAFFVAGSEFFDSFPAIIRRAMSYLINHPVLVLNRYWQPVQTCAVRRAVHLVCLGHAQVVQVDGEEMYQTHDWASWVERSGQVLSGEVIHTVRVGVHVPKVIVLSYFERMPRPEVKFTRRNVFVRDRFTCQYCAEVLPETRLNLDHVIPRDKGGRTTWQNIVTSCVRCNTRKANKLPHEAGMHPLHKPVAPRWRPLYGLRENGMADPSWTRFLDPSGDDVKLSA
jgi:5-methylcytosine-specific restriction endonuclease McrA